MMKTTRLSSKGQVIIPKPVRAAHDWKAGQELVVIDTQDGVLLKAKSPFQPTRIADAAACLKYTGKAKSLDDMEAAIKKGAWEAKHGKR